MGPLGLDGDVLDERASEGHIQDLDAAAHAEDREAAVEGASDELELERVPTRIGRAEMFARLLAVPARIDVSPASEENSVADLEGVVEVALHARQHQPDPAGQRDGPLVADARVVAEVVEAERQADDGFPAFPFHLDTYIGAL